MGVMGNLAVSAFTEHKCLEEREEGGCFSMDSVVDSDLDREYVTNSSGFKFIYPLCLLYIAFLLRQFMNSPTSQGSLERLAII
jgi:hypothetical protein